MREEVVMGIDGEAYDTDTPQIGSFPTGKLISNIMKDAGHVNDIFSARSVLKDIGFPDDGSSFFAYASEVYARCIFTLTNASSIISDQIIQFLRDIGKFAYLISSLIHQFSGSIFTYYSITAKSLGVTSVQFELLRALPVVLVWILFFRLIRMVMRGHCRPIWFGRRPPKHRRKPRDHGVESRNEDDEENEDLLRTVSAMADSTRALIAKHAAEMSRLQSEKELLIRQVGALEEELERVAAALDSTGVAFSRRPATDFAESSAAVVSSSGATSGANMRRNSSSASQVHRRSNPAAIQQDHSEEGFEEGVFLYPRATSGTSERDVNSKADSAGSANLMQPPAAPRLYRATASATPVRTPSVVRRAQSLVAGADMADSQRRSAEAQRIGNVVVSNNLAAGTAKTTSSSVTEGGFFSRLLSAISTDQESVDPRVGHFPSPRDAARGR